MDQKEKGSSNVSVCQKEQVLNSNCQVHAEQQLQKQVIVQSAKSADDLIHKGQAIEVTDKRQIQDNLTKSIIPISHQKRQRSLSPIKSQSSIAPQQYFSVKSPRVNLNFKSGFQFVPGDISNLKLQGYKPIKNQTPNSKVAYKSKFKIDEKIFLSANRENYRKTKIFSSEKKHDEKLLTIDRNTVAEKIYSQNRQQKMRNEQDHRHTHKDITSLMQFIKTPSNKKQRAKTEALQQLSQSKTKQIQKLIDIQVQPQKVQHEYWQNIYPQSKRYVTELIQILNKQKQVIKNWHSGLRMTLRQILYQLQQRIIQKLYEICRASVKTWIQQQMECVEAFQKSNFNYLSQLRTQVQRKQTQLREVDQILEKFNTDQEQKVFPQAKRPVQTSIFSGQYSAEISQISQRVKSMISKSQQTVRDHCRDNSQKLKSFQTTSEDNIQNYLQKRILNEIRHTFKVQDPIKQIQTVSKQINSQNQKLGQKNLKIIQKPQNDINNPFGNQIRQRDRNHTLKHKDQRSLSHRKNNNLSVIKDNQKVYLQFKKQFQQRRKNFLAKNVSQSQNQNKNIHLHTPIYDKLDRYQNQKNRLTSVIKNISDKKDNQDNSSGRTSRNIDKQIKNGYKTPRNKDDYFRYSMQ